LAGDEQAAADGDRASDLDPETDRVGATEPAVADLEPEPADEKVDEKK
jgi:hypothetical protein